MVANGSGSGGKQLTAIDVADASGAHYRRIATLRGSAAATRLVWENDRTLVALEAHGAQIGDFALWAYHLDGIAQLLATPNQLGLAAIDPRTLSIDVTGAHLLLGGYKTVEAERALAPTLFAVDLTNLRVHDVVGSNDAVGAVWGPRDGQVAYLTGGLGGSGHWRVVILERGHKRLLPNSVDAGYSVWW